MCIEVKIICIHGLNSLLLFAGAANILENPGSTGRQTWSRSGSQSGSVHKAESVSSLNQQQHSNVATSQWVAEQNAVSKTCFNLQKIRS